MFSVAMFGAAGAIGIWFSQPAAFVAGGVALALVISCVARKDWGGAVLPGLAGTVFLRYYSLLLRTDFREVIIGENLRKDFENTYRKELDRLQGRGRVWVLFSHVGGERERMVGYLETIGKRQDHVRYSGAFAYLFDLSSSSERVKNGN